MFENIENVLFDELEMINEQYKDGHEINAGDLEKVDKISHALKCMVTCKAMMDGEQGASGSYARGRSRTTGRYMSRAGRPEDPRGYDPYGNYR